MVLPPGDWIDWWDGTVYDGGGDVEVPAPLRSCRSSSGRAAIVPMLRPTIDTLAPATQAAVESYATTPGPLYARIAPAAENTFRLWDGAIINMFEGAYDLTPGSVFDAGFVLEILHPGEPGSVTADVALPRQATPADLDGVAAGWAWESARGGVLWVKVGPGPHRVEAP